MKFGFRIFRNRAAFSRLRLNSTPTLYELTTIGGVGLAVGNKPVPFGCRLNIRIACGKLYEGKNLIIFLGG